MRLRRVAAILLIIWSRAVAQEDSFKPRLSDAPLTNEQIAVYRAVLKDYLKGSDGVLNLANITAPIDWSDQTCFEGIAAGVIEESKSVIHRILPSFVANTKIVLVDPDTQQKIIDKNDPQNLMKKAIEGHQKVTDEQLNNAIEGAFGSALFELSEIAFDKEHRRAVVSYSFVCSELCGNGNTLVLRKVGQSWKVARRCGGWVS